VPSAFSFYGSPGTGKNQRRKFRGKGMLGTNVTDLSGEDITGLTDRSEVQRKDEPKAEF
jgi:hypothetical protein